MFLSELQARLAEIIIVGSVWFEVISDGGDLDQHSIIYIIIYTCMFL